MNNLSCSIFSFNLCYHRLHFFTWSGDPFQISIVLMSYRKNDELRKDAVDALCCLAHALGEDFTIFIPSIHKLLQKYRLRVLNFSIFIFLLISHGVCVILNILSYKFLKVAFYCSTRNLRKLNVDALSKFKRQ